MRGDATGSPKNSRYWIVAALLVVCLASLAAFAEMTGIRPDSTVRLNQLFTEGTHAYDQGRFGDAMTAFGKLVEDGYGCREVFFNLGNACFKAGQLGDAVLNYRRAWYYAPGDPDITANLKFAMQTSGGAAPTFPAAMKPFVRFGRTVWTVTAVIAYWLCAAVAVVILFSRNHRELLFRVLAAFALLLVLGLGGMLSWRQLCRNPEMVVVSGRQEALFAPLDGSTAHFALPEGSIVRFEEQSGAWVKIAAGKRGGWIKAESCRPVCPWQKTETAYAVK